MEITEYKIIQDKKLHPKLKEVQTFEYKGKIERSYECLVSIFITLFSLDRCMEEYVYVVALNANGEWLGILNIAHGGQTEAVVDNKTIFTFLLLVGASKFVLVHNHPSGIMKISDSDYILTENLEELAEKFELDLIEHIMISKNGYVLINQYEQYGSDHILPVIDF